MPEVAVVMPKMSMTMTDGEVLSWNKKAGDTVGVGDVVCEVLTDKVDMEVESPVSGVLVRVVASVGDQIAVGDPLAFIDSATSGLLDGVFGASEPAPEPAGANAGDVDDAAQSDGSDPAQANGSDPEPCVTTPPSRKARIPALPGARRRAGELGIDLANLTGTGPGGAARVSDVEKAAAELTSESNHPTQSEPATAPAPLTTPEPKQSERKPAEPKQTERTPAQAASSSDEDAADPGFADALTARKNALRKAVARAMDISATTPQFTVWSELDLTDADALRDRISWTTVLLTAFARALSDNPIGDGTAEGIAVALAVDTPVGLLGPVIRSADTRSLRELDEDVRAVARRARAGQLTGADLAGASTTFSNLGGWGVDDFNALLTPGQASALSAGAVTQRPVVRHGGLAIALTCRVGLTVDHRQADGADAARILERMKLSLGRNASEFFADRAGVGSR